MDATQKKEARMTKANMAKDTDGAAAKYGVLMRVRLKLQVTVFQYILIHFVLLWLISTRWYHTPYNQMKN